MAITRDNAAASTAGRASSRGIVMAGDRTRWRVSARRHSVIVRVLKISLPIAGVAIAGLFSLSVLKTMGWGSAIAALEIPKILPENLSMQNPHYEGYNKDGGHYWVKAETAQQDLKTLTLIKLNGITAELVDAKKQTTTLVAKRGTFDSKGKTLELFDAIDVGGDAGMKAHLTRASIDTGEKIITSLEPVTVEMSAGTIKANQMTVRQKLKEYTFVDQVQTHLNGREDAAGAVAQPAAKANEQLIGKSNAPVDITSNRLDVNDNTKVAVFSGTVLAVQDGASLASAGLEVSYEGSATPASAEGEAAGGGGKVTRMVCKNPVTLKQTNGDTVTSQSAEFDLVAQRAVLDGDVVMAQLPDKRATADKAEIDQTADTILLSGNVVVTQAQNALRGKRLVVNRGANKMQLTSPGASGRINARFQQAPNAKPNLLRDEPQQQQGMTFGASFKTDPGAPIIIDANKLDVDDTAKQAVFTGDVHAVQGDFVIRAAELSATYLGSAGLAGTGADATKQGAAQLTHIKARNKVEVTSKDGQTATGDVADFDPKANVATISGNVVLTQGKNVVRGSKLIIDMTTGEAVIPTEAAGGTNASSISADGTAIGGSSASSRPSATFYVDDIKNRAAAVKAPVKPASPNWEAQTAPGARP